MTRIPILEARSVSVIYGGVRAVDAVDLAVPADGIVGVIGPNGAGKTSLIDALTGYVRHDGVVLLDDAEVNHLAPHERARRGVRRTFQEAAVFDGLTARENLEVGCLQPGWWQLLADALAPNRSSTGPAVDEALASVGLTSVADEMASTLPVGQRRLLGVARALAGDARILILDEPAAGLDSVESHALGRHLRKICDDGTPIVLVDHDMDLVLGVCDQVLVLDSGRPIAHGTPAEVRADAAVVSAYLGTAP